MITNKEINQIVSIIAETEKPDQIILFGSYANGNPTEDSDLDLLIIKDSPLEANKRCRELRKKLRGMKVPLDLIMYTHQEVERWRDTKSAFITQVLENGMVIYGKNS